MIEMSMLEFHRSSFHEYRVRESEEELIAEIEIPFRFTSYSADPNGNQIGDFRLVEFPRKSLYEFEVGPGPIDRQLLNAAIEHAEQQALAAGHAVKGRRVYQLVLVRSANEKIWVRVGNEWNEPK